MRPPSSARAAPSAEVTVVVVPRERYSCGERTLSSLLEHTTLPFELVWVDGRSAPHVRRRLEKRVTAAGGAFVSAGRDLTPNAARNAGWRRARTPLVVFVDNDVVVAPGWLEALTSCARDTRAALVAPVTLFGPPARGAVHVAGGVLRISERGGRRRVVEEMGYAGRSLAEVRDELRRLPTELAELHCALLRRDVLERLGGFDEGMRSTREHIDLCLSLRALGEGVWLEPSAVVSYMPAPPLAPSDLRFYLLRWSDAWERDSLHHFHDKWRLDHGEYVEERLRRQGWRREHAVWKPLARRVATRARWPSLEGHLRRALLGVDRVLGRCLTEAYGAHESRS